MSPHDQPRDAVYVVEVEVWSSDKADAKKYVTMARGNGAPAIFEFRDQAVTFAALQRFRTTRVVEFRRVEE